MKQGVVYRRLILRRQKFHFKIGWDRLKNGSENNHSVMPMASLGGQGHQQEISTCQENGNDKGDGSESVSSELEHSSEEEVDERALQNHEDGELPKKKQKLTNSSDLEISGTDDYFIHLIMSILRNKTNGV